MSHPVEVPNIDDLSLSEDDDALFDSPPAQRKHARHPSTTSAGAPETPSAPPKRTAESHYTTQEAREAALRRELEGVRNVNAVIEDVITSLERAKDNMNTVNRAVTSATTLLQTWTRILSQTEHNQRLILNPTWRGATQDLVDIENEAVERQRAEERRAAEEQARREAAQRKAEEEERRKAAATVAGRGTRTRGATRGRGGSSTVGSTRGTSYVGVGGQGGRGRLPSASSRAGSGIGRGLRGARGRGTT